MTLHAVVLLLHGALRWVVLALLLLVVARSAIGLARRSGWTPRHAATHRAAVGVLDLQFLLGIALYLFLSPLPRAFLAAPAAAMKDGTLRFFTIEHITGMVVAVSLVHVGHVRAKKAEGDRARHRAALGFTLAGLLVALVTIPWPGRTYARPLLRTSLDGAAGDRGAAARAPGATGEGEAGPGGDGPSATCPPVYARRCASCHGPTGRGDGPIALSLQPRPRDFAASGWARDRSDGAIRDVIRDGGPAHGLSPAMPPHGDLPASDIDALVRCVRSLGD